MSIRKNEFYTEEELLQRSLNRTHEERYRVLMQLIKTDRALSNATIMYPYKLKPLIK